MSDKIKLCFLIRELGFGGAERQLAYLAKQLPKERYDITVIEFYNHGPLGNDLEGLPGVKRIALQKKGRWDTFHFLCRLYKTLRKERPDIIHGYLYLANVLAVLLKPLLPEKPKVVMGVRSSNSSLEHYDWSFSLLAWLEAKLSRVANLTIANSWAGYHYSLEQGVPEKKLTVIQNGIDTKRFGPNSQTRSEVRREWGVGDNEIVIGINARFDPKKNHPVFFKAGKLFVEKHPKTRFVIIANGGSDQYRDSLKKLTEELGIAEKVLWEKKRTDIERVTNAFDIATLCSNAAEGFPNVLLESMITGIPSVSTDSGDAKYILGREDLLMKEPTPEALNQAWEYTLTLNRDEFSREANKHIVDNFSLEELVRRTDNVLQELLVPAQQQRPFLKVAGYEKP